MLLGRDQYPGALGLQSEMTNSGLVRGFGAPNTMLMPRCESSPTETLVAMLASYSSPMGLQGSRSSGRLEDAVVGCGQKRGPLMMSYNPSFETASADETAAGYDDVGDDSSCAMNNVEKKRRLTFDQVTSLEKNFEVENKLESDRKMQLAKELGLQPRQVAVWFQNRRARWKTKQLERDYEVLNLDYNRLKSELEAAIEEKQELQAKVQWLSGKAKPEEESGGCQTGEVCNIVDRTAGLLQPVRGSNDHVEDQPKLEKITAIELSNSACREIQNQRSFPEAAMPSTARKDGSPPSSASTSSEILDADSPRIIDSCSLNSLTQTVNLKSSTFLYINSQGGCAAANTVTVNPSSACMIDHLSMTESEMCARVFCDPVQAYGPRIAVKLEEADQAAATAGAAATVFQEDPCNYLLNQAADIEHGALPWWDWP